MDQSNPLPAERPLPRVPFERASSEELRAHIALVSESPIVTALLDAIDANFMVVNAHRQVLAANRLPSGSEAALKEALGRRPGEALVCAQAVSHPDGCGAADACRNCGLLRAFLTCQQRQAPAESEFLLTTADKGVALSAEFNVRASPVKIGEEHFTVLSLRDISSEKRRQALEQVFFHDVLNTLSGLVGWNERLRALASDDSRRVVYRVGELVSRLVRDIADHRSLLQAESGTLEPSFSQVRLAVVFEGLRSVFASHPAARERLLEFESPAPDVEVETDPSLLQRVLTNMVKNALEATPEGGRVRVWSEGRGPDEQAFLVHNETVIPPLVASRIFQRSFSTKATTGRGLGTYSMKLLGEQILGGKVSFRSRPGEGTSFAFVLPVRP